MIEFQNSFLRAISMVEPERFISSDEIENDLRVVYEKLKLPFGRIEMQTGVQTRGVYPDALPSQIAIGAAKNLFSENEIVSEEIDLLIYCGVCRDYLEPSTASSIHYKLGLRPDCASFDLSNACLGVVNAMTFAANMLETGKYKNILLVTGENSYPLLKKTLSVIKDDETLTRKTIKKFFANFTIGSAGVALVISSEKGIAELKKYNALSNTSTYELCQGGGSTEELTMETDSELLMQEGIKLARKTWEPFANETFDHYICHQVGIHHRNFLYDSLGLDMDKDTTTFDKYGNTGSAALPLTLLKAIPKFKAGDKIALLGIGSGLHTTAMEMRWI